jgi:hypothetical protein
MTVLVRRCGTYWAHMALALLDTDEEPVVVDQSISRRGRSPVVEKVFDIGRETALLDAIEPVEPPAVASPDLHAAVDR